MRLARRRLDAPIALFLALLLAVLLLLTTGGKVLLGLGLRILVFAELLVQQVHGIVVDAGVQAALDFDVVLLEEIKSRAYRYVQVFCYFTYFRAHSAVFDST